MSKQDYCYLRLSLEDDDMAAKGKRESDSITSQRQIIMAYVKEHPDIEAHPIEMCDDGYSGSNFDRPAVHELLRQVERGAVRTIIVKDLSRFGREFLQVSYYLEYFFPLHQVRFIAIGDQYDSKMQKNTTLSLNFAVQNIVNDMYSKDISHKIKSVVHAKKMRGEYVYGQVPFGYCKGAQKNTIVPDAPAAQVVRMIFTHACNGIKVAQIAKQLNAEEITTPSAYLAKTRGNYKIRNFWTYESVRNILTNRIYTGDTEPYKSHVRKIGSKRVQHIPPQEREVIANTHEAIVSREMYFDAQEVIQKHAVKIKKEESVSVLANYLVCGCCGNKLHKGRASNQNYKCATARYLPTAACALVRCKDAEIQQKVLHAIQCHAGMHVDMTQGNAPKLQGSTATQKVRMELQKLSTQQEECRKGKVQLYERFINQKIDKTEFVHEKEQLSARESALKDEIAMHKAQMQGAMQISAQNHTMQMPAMSTLTPQMMAAFVKRVIIMPDGTIELEWNFRDAYA